MSRDPEAIDRDTFDWKPDDEFDLEECALPVEFVCCSLIDGKPGTIKALLSITISQSVSLNDDLSECLEEDIRKVLFDKSSSKRGIGEALLDECSFERGIRNEPLKGGLWGGGGKFGGGGGFSSSGYCSMWTT